MNQNFINAHQCGWEIFILKQCPFTIAETLRKFFSGMVGQLAIDFVFYVSVIECNTCRLPGT